jgi:hypothetical protein
LIDLEVINGILVSKPAVATKKEPKIIDLQEYVRSGKATAIVQGIHKVRAIHDFLNSKY